MPRHVLYDGAVTINFDGRAHMYTWIERGVAVPGVTSILQRMAKPMLVPWAAKMSAQYVLQTLGEVDYALGEVPAEERNDLIVGTTLGELQKICLAAKGHHQRFTREAASIGKKVHAYAEARLRATMPGDKSKGRQPPLPDTNDERVLRGCDAYDKWIEAHKVEVIEPERVLFSQRYLYSGTADFMGYIDDEYVVGDFKTSSGIYVDHLLQTAAYQLALEEELGDRVPARWLIRLDKKTGDFHAERHARSKLHGEAFLALRELHRLMSKIEAAR